MSIIGTMNIAQQSLMVNQSAISVISNNVANVNTEGYHKQRVNLATLVNYDTIGNDVYKQVGSSAGVQITQIQRYTDAYLQNYYRDQSSTYSYYDKASSIASSVESVMNELAGTGIEKALTEFYTAATTLANTPTDNTARLNFMEQAKSVAQKFNTTYSTLENQRTTLVGDPNNVTTLDQSDAALMVKDINSKIEQIAKVNNDIITVSSGDLSPNNLLDQRDSLIDELSTMVGVTVTENSNGTVNISLGDKSLIKGTKVTGTLDISVGDEDTPAVIKVLDDKGNLSEPINEKVTSGELGAILQMGGPATATGLSIKGVMEDLNTLAKGFADVINDVQTQTGARGIDKDTMTLMSTDSTEAIFKISQDAIDAGETEITAGNITINSTVYDNPYLVAAAKVDPDNYDPKAVGNNANALEFGKTRETSYGTLGNSTPEGFLTSLVGEIGIQTETLNNSQESQALVVKEVATQLKNETGVNIDEEMIDLIKYQRAYEASARIFNTCNSILDVLVNLGA